jgi:hypothetical protein
MAPMGGHVSRPSPLSASSIAGDNCAYVYIMPRRKARAAKHTGFQPGEGSAMAKAYDRSRPFDADRATGTVSGYFDDFARL